MKKVVSLVVMFLCTNVLHSMELHSKDEWSGRHELYRKKIQQALQRSFDKAELVADFQGLSEDYYWQVDNPIAKIQSKLATFKKKYGNDAMEGLKSDVIEFPETLQYRLEYSEKTRNIGGMIGLGSIGLVAI